ncbi:MAG: DUF3488 domain-containing transglutaminase family protein, partial [Bdellovibrionales bacterium]|nr:DUF3488 domain-containing transglutaminase family protein [Bdellovibrionales bacterium]
MNPVPTRAFHLNLLLLVSLNFLPHLSTYPLATIVAGGGCLLWRLLYEYGKIPLPNFWVKTLLVATSSILVFNSYGQLFGLESGTALLLCAVALKMVDRVAYRDAMVLLFLTYILLLARFFESQSLFMTIFAGFDIIIATALLIQLHQADHQGFDLRTLLKIGAKLLLQVAPVMVLLFFVFPRFSTTFLGLAGPKQSLVNFNDLLDPGSVESVAKTDFVAFRVRFPKGELPPPHERYWRGPVLDESQGMLWTRGKVYKVRGIKRSLKEDAEWEQEILLEPYFNKWLFALDRPVALSQSSEALQRSTRTTSAGSIYLRKGLNRRMIYQAYSSLRSTEGLDTDSREAHLKTEKPQDPRLLDLLASVNQTGLTNVQKADRLLAFYQKEFRYTLEPGTMQSKSVSEFLFDKKVGFCEHFAASFASVMRMAGVPARVVIGFQGGEKNKYSDYYIVGTKDAHAWTEIWSDRKQGWLRYDPTSVVAPLRLQIGGQLFHQLTPEQLQQMRNDQNYLSQWNAGWVKKAALGLDAIATKWNLFLLSFDRDKQESFFKGLGFDKVQSFWL